ncbi:MAG: hypothetical protein ACYS9X_01430 [Planctomycetota bacterium]
MRIRTARDARPVRARSWPAFAGACVLAATVMLAAAPERATGQETPGGFSVKIALPDGKETFHRGGLDPAAPVNGLIVTVTITNTLDDLAVTLPMPELTPYGGVGFARAQTVSEGGSVGLAFEIDLMGAPTGVRKTDDTPERTGVPRNPLAVPLTSLAPQPAVTLGPGESKDFRANVGSWYAVRKAGRYEMSCMFENQRSNAIEFEVLPLKVVNTRAAILVGRVEDFERNGSDYPFMFYVAHGDGRFDEVVYLVRRGTGADERYEYHRLAEMAPGTVPQMVTDPEKPGRVGLLVPDKRNASLSRIFTVDMGILPMRVSGKEVGHEPGRPPQLALGDLAATRK